LLKGKEKSRRQGLVSGKPAQGRTRRVGEKRKKLRLQFKKGKDLAGSRDPGIKRSSSEAHGKSEKGQAEKGSSTSPQEIKRELYG